MCFIFLFLFCVGIGFGGLYVLVVVRVFIDLFDWGVEVIGKCGWIYGFLCVFIVVFVWCI